MSVMVTGPSANGAIAARVGMVSEMSRMLNSPPWRRSGPLRVMECSFSSMLHPIAVSTLVPNARSPCADLLPSPAMVTLRLVTAAAARKYEAVDASGSTGKSAAWYTCGLMSNSGPVRSTRTPKASIMAIVRSM